MYDGVRTVMKVKQCFFKNEDAGFLKKRAGSVKRYSRYLKVKDNNIKKFASSITDLASFEEAKSLELLTPHRRM